MDNKVFILIFTAFIFGLRHGFDWDHIAAISDFTGSAQTKLEKFINASIYALGHAAVVFLLGILLIGFGVTLPSWIDQIMEPVVGLTLIMLGLVLLYQVFKKDRKLNLKSRWTYLINAVLKISNLILHKLHIKHTHNPIKIDSLGKRGALVVGIIHGIGVETPTQVLLFIAASGSSNIVSGLLILLSFVLGLLISNTLVTLVSLFGFTSLKNHRVAYLTLGCLAGVFSLVLGLVLVLGSSFTKMFLNI